MRLTAALVLFGCSGEPAPTASPPPPPTPVVREHPDGPPSLVLVVWDTVRADHIGAYGYTARPTTPHLDALAARSDRYSRAWSSSPWTLPSHASLFTGLDPSVHGAVTATPGGPQRDAWPLPEDAGTLAEVLGAAGYETVGYVGNRAYLDPQFGLAQGFATWELPASSEGRGAGALTEAGLSWLDRGWSGEAPFLLFLNLMDAHRPYPEEAPEGWSTPPAYPPGEAAQGSLAALDRLRHQVEIAGEPPDPALREALVARYDQGIARNDAALGLLLEGLAARGLSEDVVLLVTSDHGEAFGEHGIVEHSKDVWEPLVRVPLVLHAPGQVEGRVVDTAVSSAHVPGLLSQHLPALGELPVPDEVIVENRYARPRDQGAGRHDDIDQAAIRWPWKLVRHTPGQTALYRLDQDPAEAHDLLPSEPEQAGALQALLPDPVEPDRPPSIPTRSFEEQEALRELGYVE